MVVLGIDIGGSGIKGAPVDVERGTLTVERHRIPTPQPATPKAVAKTVAAVAKHFRWTGPIGCGLPSAIQRGIVRTAANISDEWLGMEAQQVLEDATGSSVTVINDADAAGYAEMHFGAGRGRTGVVMLVTLGTGIGSAVFVNGHLLPNTELGHLEMDGREAEKWAADSVREAKGLSWKKWAERVQDYLQHLERWFWPDLFIIGGGVSKKADKFLPYIELATPVVAAKLQNEAGIVGAALAWEHARQRTGKKLALP
jgi:polyphosphate glucokinase